MNSLMILNTINSVAKEGDSCGGIVRDEALGMGVAR